MASLTASSRFLLISLISPAKSRHLIQSELDEAVALIAAYGGTLATSLTQNESHFNQGTFIGKGKVDEIASLISPEEIDIVVVNDNLSASQLFSLKESFSPHSPQIKVWDRTDLILNIFSQNATTAEAKLQIKLAETRHRGPELAGLGKDMSQPGAGIGTRGKGETQTEIKKRHWRSEIKNIEQELHKLTTGRHRQMEHRKRLRLPTISIIGYTNAGKSTLFNLLTRKPSLIKNAPFVTLDSSVGKLYLHGLQKEAFVTDTIGFIQNLPTDLIESFQSTLMETINADLLLQVVDIADPFFPEKITTVEMVLDDLEIRPKKRLLIFNKIDHPSLDHPDDLITDLKNHFAQLKPQFISALTGQGHPELLAAIEQELK
jgi:GTPase